jgi:hypothetical protein
MGYTPLFDSLLSGTLYGRWPHTGVWACLLSRATREGRIDEVPKSLADAIGIPVDLLLECINDFMQPDPCSRTATNDGRRLELIDPERPWGWRIINHGKYREKARKSAFDAERVQSGDNAERMAARRASADKDPTGPAKTREDPLSSQTQTEEEEAAKAATPPKSVRSRKSNKTAISEGFELTGPMLAYALEHLPDVNCEKFFDGFVGKAKAKGWKYVDWEQAWQEYVRNSAPGSGHWAASSYPKNKGNRLAI